MPCFRVNGSCMLAQYQTGSLVIHHHTLIYDLKTSLQPYEIDKLSIGTAKDLHVYLKDGTQLILQPKSAKEAAKYHMTHRLKLRALQQKHANKALKYAKAIQAAAEGLVEVQRELYADAEAVAGQYFRNYHTVGFDLDGSNQDQVERDGFVTTPDVASVLKMANNMVDHLQPVVSAEEPLPLLYEDEDSDDE